MGMGIPVLHGVAGESAEIVDQESVGIVLEPENDIELVNQLVLLKNDRARYRQLQANCLEAAKHYDRQELAALMLEKLESLANTNVVSATTRERPLSDE